ncbi:MAG: hypothetical protein U0R76_16220 [Candidatus Nanopelagicales bacterium]
MSHQAPSGPGRRAHRSLSSSAPAPAVEAPSPYAGYPPPSGPPGYPPPPASAYPPPAAASYPPPAAPSPYPPPSGYAGSAAPTYNPYAPPPQPPLRAWGSAPPPSPPLLGRREVVALVALGVVLVLTAVFVVQRIGTSPRVPGDSRDASRIAAIAGYQVNGGPHGRAMEAGGPWGFACAPVLFRLDASTPPAVAAQFSGVVSAASQQGLNVAAVVGGADPTSGTLTGDPTSWVVVPVTYSLAAAPANEEGRPMSLGGEYGGRLTPDGRWEDYTFWTLVLYGSTLGDDAFLQRKAARVAVARVTGLAGSLSPSSGITRGMRSEVDAFTPADLAAMHAMSGCPAPPTR